ncbi:hypothetical protein [Aestuariirhabdus sp. LZHN29]|uniref:hypothetical protein n=1 Tax=Aestuariirhabdus sp. LZHN29 TaxID=3417462 RepID=UPI003CF0926C
MFQLFINFSRVGVLGLWAIYLLGFVIAYPAPWNAIVFWGGIVLFAAHLMEYLALRSKITSAGGDGSGGLIGTLVFGYGYWLPLLRK